MKTSVLIFLLICSLFTLQAQDEHLQKYSSTITLDELREHVKILSSDDFMGRETGREGEQKAAEYILDKFVSLKLTGRPSTEKPFLQEFELNKAGWDSFSIVKGLDTLNMNREMQVSGSWKEGDQDIEIIFAGYGADTEHYSSYSDINVEGKIVAFFIGEPMSKDGLYLTTNTYLPEYSLVGFDKARIATKKGAIGAILIHPDQAKIDKIISMGNRFSKAERFSLPGTSVNKLSAGLINISEESASLLFGNKISDWAKYRKKLNKGKSINLESDGGIKMITDKGSNKVISENIFGMIKGSTFPDEYIIITAHYDHLGQRDDKIFNGADDNASGTAAVIEIAEAFAEASAAGFTPKRSIIFMPVSGEEKGLLGSKYYTVNPIVPLKNTKAAINMDMIGRQDAYEKQDTSYVFLYISDEPDSAFDRIAHKSSELEGDNMLTLMKYNNSNDFSLGGSDHVSFEKVGIPVMYFYCGTHKDYHRPSDTWEKLDYPNFTRISRMVFASAWQLANKD